MEKGILTEALELWPLLVGIVGTALAWNKDYIQNVFTKKKNALEIEATRESIEAANLANVQTEHNILKDMLHTNTAYYQNRIVELESDFERTLNSYKNSLEEHKKLIVSLSRSLDYYEKKHGKIIIKD